jgi:hypothetical protein
MKNNSPLITFKEFCWTAAGVLCAAWALWALAKEGIAAQDTAAAAGIWATLIFMHVSSGGCHTDAMQEHREGEAFAHIDEQEPVETTLQNTQKQVVWQKKTQKEYLLLW